MKKRIFTNFETKFQNSIVSSYLITEIDFIYTKIKINELIL